MFCTKCGAELRDGASFCTKCGAGAGESIPQGQEAAAAREPEPIEPAGIQAAIEAWRDGQREAADGADGDSSDASEPDADGGADAAESADGADASEPAAYELVPDLDVTDEIVAEIRDLAAQCPEDGGRAESLALLALDNRDRAVTEEEARKAAEAEAARVQARKDAITATAYDYIYRAYDNCEPSLAVSKNRGSFRDLYSPRARIGNGWGWLCSSLISLDAFDVIDENTVSFSVTYRYGTSKSNSVYTREGVLTFDENALILTGGVGIMPS